MSILEQLKAEVNAIEQELRSLLDDELGYFNDGSRAIWKGANIPSDLRTTGLQLCIIPVPEGDAMPLSAGQTYLDHAWVIEMKNFDRSSPALAVARRKIETQFITKEKSRYQPATDLFLEQCKCFIYRPRVANKPQTL